MQIDRYDGGHIEWIGFWWMYWIKCLFVSLFITWKNRFFQIVNNSSWLYKPLMSIFLT